MTMRVRACVLAVVLVVLGASSVFGQNVWTAGAPTGSVYAGSADFNLAMNAEGNRELAAPVTICTGGAAGGATIAGAGAVAAAGATTASFNVGDIFTIEYKAAGQADPIFAPGNTGALGSANLFLVQSVAGVGVTATASAAMVAGPVVAGAAAAAPQAIVTVTVTGAPAAGTGINCISIQAMRFDLGNTKLTAALTPAGLTSGSLISATVIQTVFNSTTIPVVQTSGAGPGGIPAACTVLAPCAIPFLGLPPASNVSPGFPVIGGVATATNAVGTAVATVQIGGGSAGIANSTGVGQFQKTGLGVLAAPAPIVNGVTRTGQISLQQQPIPATTAAACVPACPAGAAPVNAPIQDGGGTFRAYNTPVGPDQTTWLNLSGATTGTTFTFTVAGMPTGSSVSFPTAITSASPGVVLTAAGGGTIAAPGGSVSYVVTVNEGSPYALGGTPAGPSFDITYTVTPGTVVSTGFGATVVISVGPAAGASAIPTYSQINAAAVNETSFPVVGVGTLPTTLFTVATNQTTKNFPYVTFTGGSAASDYDTGLVLDNTALSAGAPRGVSVLNGTSCFNVGAGLQPPAGCVTIPVAAAGNLAGQDGAFTVFFISSSAAVTSIRSTATCSGGGAFPGSAANTATKYNGLTSGVLKQGDYWVALASQVLSCAGITGAWSGQVSIVADMPSTTGFGFISQFFNASGGATMGYVAP